MIYTLTLNPALDYVMRLDSLKNGAINSSQQQNVFYGGKGINVSTVLHTLGIASTAMGFIAGFSGEELCRGVQKIGVFTDFIRLSTGLTRINVKLRTDSETDINANGPDISQADIDALCKRLSRINDGDTLVLAGSVPSNLPDDIYAKILYSVKDKNFQIAVDTTGNQLKNILKFSPFVIKPNIYELYELFSDETITDESTVKYAAELQRLGAQNVLVSMDKRGALLLDQNGKLHKKSAFNGKLINSVGAGDAMLAGFIAGWHQRGDYDYALSLGIAAGSATAFSEGLADKQSILELMQ